MFMTWLKITIYMLYENDIYMYIIFLFKKYMDVTLMYMYI